MRKRERIVGAALVVSVLLGGVALLFAALGGDGDWWLELLRLTDRTIAKPSAFGVFHLCWLAACILLSLLFGVLGNRYGKRLTDRAVMVAGLFLLLLEIYKQFYSYFILHDQIYDFGIFPFQFCSLPLYLYLLVPFLREGRIKDALYKFLALFGTMGGCLVMVYPAFYNRASLCVHTMLWHTVMISVGVLILFSRDYGKSWRREVLCSTPVFLGFLGFSTLLNIVLTPHAAGSPNPLNLFYMSPYEKTYFAVVGDVQRTFGWLPSMIVYVLLFIFVGASLVFFVTFLIRKWVCFLAEDQKKT